MCKISLKCSQMCEIREDAGEINLLPGLLHNRQSSKLLKRIKHGFLYFVRNLDDITSPLQILDLYNSFESYDSKLGCRSLWDTLY